jgi:hypothetical protein
VSVLSSSYDVKSFICRSQAIMQGKSAREHQVSNNEIRGFRDSVISHFLSEIPEKSTPSRDRNTVF